VSKASLGSQSSNSLAAKYRRAGLTAVVLLAAAFSLGCWPAHPANEQLIGTWEADHEFGRETLVLAGDGVYKQIFTRADGRIVENAGRWSRGTDARLSLSGLKVILRDARVFDSPSGDLEQRKSDRELEAVTEWGRTMLVFNPDLPGFLRK
jgi:hypothetical protein